MPRFFGWFLTPSCFSLRSASFLLLFFFYLFKQDGFPHAYQALVNSLENQMVAGSSPAFVKRTMLERFPELQKASSKTFLRGRRKKRKQPYNFQSQSTFAGYSDCIGVGYQQMGATILV